MRDLFLLGTNNVLFSYNNNNIYTQTDSVTMGSPLSPILASTFMVELEGTRLLTIRKYKSAWKRYLDDTISSIKEKFIE